MVATHPIPRVEANRMCATFCQRSSSENLPENTTKAQADLIPERIIRTEMKEAAEKDQEFTLSELDEILLHRKEMRLQT